MTMLTSVREFGSEGKEDASLTSKYIHTVEAHSHRKMMKGFCDATDIFVFRQSTVNSISMLAIALISTGSVHAS